MYRKAAKLVADRLTLTSVQSCTDRNAQRLNSIADRAGTANRSSRTIERCEESVSGGVDLTATISFKLPPHEHVMLHDEMTE